MIKVKIDSKKAEAHIDRIASNLKRESRKAVNRMAERGSLIAKKNAPEFTGALISAIKFEKAKPQKSIAEAWVLQQQPDQASTVVYNEKIWRDLNWIPDSPYHIWFYDGVLNSDKSGDPRYWKNMINTLESQKQEEINRILRNSVK